MVFLLLLSLLLFLLRLVGGGVGLVGWLGVGSVCGAGGDVVVVDALEGEVVGLVGWLGVGSVGGASDGVVVVGVLGDGGVVLVCWLGVGSVGGAGGGVVVVDAVGGGDFGLVVRLGVGSVGGADGGVVVVDVLGGGGVGLVGGLGVGSVGGPDGGLVVWAVDSALVSSRFGAHFCGSSCLRSCLCTGVTQVWRGSQHVMYCEALRDTARPTSLPHSLASTGGVRASPPEAPSPALRHSPCRSLPLAHPFLRVFGMAWSGPPVGARP